MHGQPENMRRTLSQERKQMKTYQEFLEAKILRTGTAGFRISAGEIHKSAFPHQLDVIQWAALGGRRAIFAQFGLGKSMMQLELMKTCLQQHPGRGLIICPLGVRQEFKKEADRLGIQIHYVRTTEEVLNCPGTFMITNYERVRDGGIDVNLFTFVSLDEASILRSFGSKTYHTFLDLFTSVPYRYVCTATPSPNRYKELIHYAGFLGVMDTGQALTRFFKRDSTKANNLTLYDHKEREFWLWVSSWAIFLTKPSDLGYSDDGYDLPPLNVHYHMVNIEQRERVIDSWGQVKAFRDPVLDLKSASKEKRDSLGARIEKAVEIISSDFGDDRHWLIWHHLEDERRAIEKALPEARTVFGTQDLDEREELLIGFGNGDYRILATKPEIAGSGCNFQTFCHSNIFLGVDYKFNDFIQAIHRTHRFQQSQPVDVHIIYTENEENVVQVLQEKWKRHDELVQKMTEIIKEFGLSHASMFDELRRTIGLERKEVNGELFTVVNNDCVLEVESMDENSVDLIHTSIPFSNHYEYTPSYNDFGHTNDNGHFWAQMDYLTPGLLRILKPGRIYACHVKDRILFGNVTGAGVPTVSPFHAEAIFHGIKHRFDYMGMITVVTDVVRENNQTYRLGWTENCKDGTKMGVGSPEYVLLFRKPQTDRSRGYADIPVTKSKDEYGRAQWQIDAHAFWRSSGNRLLTPEEIVNMDITSVSEWYRNFSINNVYDYQKHVELGKALEPHGYLPSSFMLFQPQSKDEMVWTDVNRMRTLNMEQSRNRQQQHVCPLQFDIVERIINRYTNPGELVFDPFGGLMTVPYCAIKMGRKGRGVELSEDYFKFGVEYCRDAENEKLTPSLFDCLEVA